MKSLSLDLRERISVAYDAHAGLRAEVAVRFGVSSGLVYA
jgi:transposase